MLSRAEISARLKAARWLAYPDVDSKGQPKSLKNTELVKLRPVRSNLSKNRLDEAEQAKTGLRPMELEKLADALQLPLEWFTEPDLRDFLRRAIESLEDANGQPEEPEDVVADFERESEPGEDRDDATGSPGANG